MRRRFLANGPQSAPLTASAIRNHLSLLWMAAVCAMAAFVAAGAIAAAQVMTIDLSGNGTPSSNSPVDRQYRQIEPTHVNLSQTPLDTKTRLELVRVMQADQGFAMRPLPRGHKGLTLVANGKLEPAGVAYLNMAISEGLSVKPGERVVVTDVKFERDKIVLELNGGPDLKHRIMRHIQIGMGPDLTDPIMADNSEIPTGSRITLAFKGRVPELTGAQVKALLAPLVSFDVKTPIQAYTDTLPAALKEAILSHEVLVGMNTDMVLFAKGQPWSKIREMDGQMPFEVWIYGKPPEPTEFVRINGNRVIRVEIARVGKPVEVFTTDVVTAMMQADGTQLTANSNVRMVREGDVQRDPNREAPAPPPTLRNPGEQLPTDHTDTGVMKPVHFPASKPAAMPGTNPDDQQPAAPAPAAQPATGSPQTAPNAQPAPGNQPGNQFQSADF